MFDTMTLTKIVGGVCGTFLVFLLGGWGAELIYEPAESHGEGEEHAQGYVIPVEDSTASAEPEEEIDVAAVLASGDAASGEGLFRNCRSCHAVAPGENMTGPTLHGVVGRGIDTVPDYAYSGALEQLGDVWSPEVLFAFLEDPRGTAPGTKMTYAGMRDPQDRADLIAWLATQDG
ncbi:c-type cytochrome [Wenxinia saemankumensis]|nr:cytochrome c family protein [Wenxinia saemankumensis]